MVDQHDIHVHVVHRCEEARWLKSCSLGVQLPEGVNGCWRFYRCEWAKGWRFILSEFSSVRGWMGVGVLIIVSGRKVEGFIFSEFSSVRGWMGKGLIHTSTLWDNVPMRGWGCSVGHQVGTSSLRYSQHIWWLSKLIYSMRKNSCDGVWLQKVALSTCHLCSSCGWNPSSALAGEPGIALAWHVSGDSDVSAFGGPPGYSVLLLLDAVHVLEK